MRSLRYLAIATALLCAAPALAISFRVTGWDAGEVVRVSYAGSAHSYLTVQFHETVDGATGTSFCADLAQTIGQATYTSFAAWDPTAANSQPFATSPPHRTFTFAASIVDKWGNDLGWLENKLGVTHVQAITGVQSAVWEAVYGNNFTATSHSMSHGAWDVFNYVLGYKGYQGTGNVKLYFSRTNQDQLFTTPPVPEPSALLVFGAGALLVGGALRRRASA